MKEHEHPYWNKGNYPHASDKDLKKASNYYHDAKKADKFYDVTHKIRAEHEEKENKRFT